MLTHAFSRHIARQAVKMDRRDHRVGNAIGILSDQACDHSGQYVAGASGRHAGISCGVYPYRAVGLRDQGPVAFEDDNQLMFSGKTAGNVYTVVLYGGNRGTRQPRHFAGMRRDDQSSRDFFFNPAAWPSNAFRPSASRTIGNLYFPTTPRTNSDGFRMARNTRADRQHGLSLGQSVHFSLLQCAYRNATGSGFVQGLSHQFRMKACHRRQN